MANTKISALGAATALAGTEELPAVQSAATVKATVDQIRDVVKAVDATSTDGVILETSTAATVGAQKWSPRIRWKGFGWKTNATAASQAVEFAAEVQPVQGAAAPTGSWVLKASINGGAYADAMKVRADGYTELLGNGTSWQFDTQTTSGTLYIGNTGNARMAIDWNDKVKIGTALVFGWTSAGGAANSIDTGLSRKAAKVIELNNGTAGTYPGVALNLGTQTVAQLTAAATAGAGALAFVSDATATTPRSTVAGGGANKVLVMSDATNWLIVA